MEGLQSRTEFDGCMKQLTVGSCAKQRVSRAGAQSVMAVACLGLVLSAATSAMQLPPEVQLDRYLLQMEDRIEERDFVGAKEAMDRIWKLKEQNDLEIPVAFLFEYAQILERLEMYDETIEAVTRYLTVAGRNGPRYSDALKLLNSAESARAAAEEARKRTKAVIVEMEFVRIPAGQFWMGSTSADADDDEQPVTQVRISRGFWLGKYEVTQAEWQAVMGANPSEFYGCSICPVENVSWNDVQEFIGRLNATAGGCTTACRRKRNGSMRQGRGRAGTATANWKISLGTRATARVARIRWGGRHRMHGACTTCWGTYANLCRTGMATIRVAQWWTPKAPVSARIGCVEGALGGRPMRGRWTGGCRVAMALITSAAWITEGSA